MEFESRIPETEVAELTGATTGTVGLFSPEDPAESSAANDRELEPFSLLFLFCVTLLRGAPWAVTKCFLRYHLFFTTFSHSEHDTPKKYFKKIALDFAQTKIEYYFSFWEFII